MNDSSKKFSGCAIKFEFPGLDLDVATVDDIDQKNWRQSDITPRIVEDEEDEDEEEHCLVGSKNAKT